MKHTLPLLTALLLAPLAALHAAESVTKELHADIVVYCATSAGVPAAVAAAREGRTVILVEPGRWLGGLLGAGFRMSEDVPYHETLGGMARKFVETDMSWGGFQLDWQANRNQALFKEMLAPFAQRIQIVYEHRVRRVEKNGACIVALLLENALHDKDGVPAAQAVSDALVKVNGKVFIDASYEGDVMAWAGVKYRVGRESKNEYKESLGGVRGITKFPGVDPYRKRGDRSSGLLPMIPADPLGEPGSASRFSNGYNFKLPKSSAKAGISIPAPNPKDPLHCEFLKRIKEAGKKITWPTFNFLRGEVCTGAIPGAQVDYPDGDWPTRARVWRSYIEHIKYLNDFTGKDFRFPADQNIDTGGWPHELYMRATRRMLGRYVMTQADLALQTDIQDSIGMAYYPVDIYPCRLVVLGNGTLAYEGDTFVLVSPGPYRISYRAITPKAEECANLLVPVCLSASHVAHASIRMEGTYMVLGESAGVAAAQAITQGKPVQNIDMPLLQDNLRKVGQHLAWDGKGYYYFKWNAWHKEQNKNLKGWWLSHPEEYSHYLPKPPPDNPTPKRTPELP